MAISEKRLPRYYVENIISMESYDALTNLAAQHSNVAGVEQIAYDAGDRLLAFDKVRKKLIKRYQPKADRIYEEQEAQFSKYQAVKRWLIIAVFALIILFMFGSFIDSLFPFIAFIRSIVMLVLSVAIPVLFVLLIVLRIQLNNVIKKYLALFVEIRDNVQSENSKFDKANAVGCKQIDSLYLSSLSTAERELVLMRREQQKQHDEMMREQKRHQSEVEALQRQIQKDQRELLEYERDRQRRMNKFR